MDDHWVAIPGQLTLGINAEMIEPVTSLYHMQSSEKKKHPGRNVIRAHLNYINMYPDNLPENAGHFETIETEQFENDPS